MNDDLAIEKQSKAAIILNVILLVFNFVLALGVIALKFSRETYVEISNQIYSPDKPLMDSTMLDFMLQKGMSIVIFIILAWIVGKEIRIKSIHRRLRLNLAVFVGLSAYATLLLYLIYVPVINMGG